MSTETTPHTSHGDGPALHHHSCGSKTSGNGRHRADRHVDLAAIEQAVRTILVAVGEDPERSGLMDTPQRVARMYAEMFAGLKSDPARHLRVTFPENYDEIVLVRDIAFTSMCEHHLLPFRGVAHVAYIPEGRVTGLSKLARVVDDVARRPQVQERMTHMIADLVERELASSGVAVVIQAEHSCMSIRGVQKPGSTTVTSALRGVFKSNASSRAEVLALINQRQ
jgi:GTP cyclohydrolase IA